jgi:hypothetical protein
MVNSEMNFLEVILANRKMNKLDVYAETRLWNLKLQNKHLATETLMKEIIFRFNLVDSVTLYPDLKKIIQAARRRVMRRHTKMKKNITTWSSKLFLPEDIVAHWARKDLLTEKNFAQVSEILSNYRELFTSEEV